MRLAPLGAGGAMAFTIGRYGVAALLPLGALIGELLSDLPGLFVRVVLGTIAALAGFNIFRFLAYIKDELLTVLGTSSSEAGLVPLMHKLERLGCSKSVIGLVVPSGYSFNLDGTNIYLTMAAIFVAQALNIDLTLTQQVTLLVVALADGERRVGRDRRRIHHARGHAGRRAVRAGRRPCADARHRSLHVRGARAHELHRQRRRDDRRVALGGRARSCGAQPRASRARRAARFTSGID